MTTIPRTRRRSLIRLARYLAACAVVGLVLGVSTAAEPATFRVISYNVQFLPGIASIANKRKDAPYRARAIGEQLADYDICGFNEIFDDKIRPMLLDKLRGDWGDRYGEILAPKPDKRRFMGGCAIVSRWPLLATSTLVYSVGSSPEKYGIGADGHAAKGAVHARIQLPGGTAQDFVDVFTTHLEARADELRPTQYRELADFIRQQSSPDHPMLLLGDMNTNGVAEEMANPDSEYHLMLRTYQAGRGTPPLIDLWPKFGQGRGGTTEQESSDIGKRIDYIFLSNPVGREVLTVREIKVNGFLDQRVGALSDHSAVEALLQWNTSTPSR